MWGINFPVERLMRPYSFCVKQLLKWFAPKCYVYDTIPLNPSLFEFKDSIPEPQVKKASIKYLYNWSPGGINRKKKRYLKWVDYLFNC